MSFPGDDGRIDVAEFHWILEVLQHVDVGLVVLDRNYRVRLWNQFMQNHSGRMPEEVIDRPLSEVAPEIPQRLLRRKIESVFLLRNRAFITWEQRPYLFRFRNYRPITGTVEHMYQNITFIPLRSTSGEVDHVCLLVYDVTDVAVSREALARANAELAQLSRTDALTGLNNRGYWEQLLEHEFNRCRRSGAKSSLVMFDIDHFKSINDTHGHQAGDAVLRRLADVLRRNVRATDVPGRYGGEEFVVLLVDADEAGARYFAERLRRSVEAGPVTHEGNELRFTISLGAAEWKASLAHAGQWVQRADEALYRAKNEGRNRVRIGSS